jgi:hypothetical protein
VSLFNQWGCNEFKCLNSVSVCTPFVLYIMADCCLMPGILIPVLVQIVNKLTLLAHPH